MNSLTNKTTRYFHPIHQSPEEKASWTKTLVDSVGIDGIEKKKEGRGFCTIKIKENKQTKNVVREVDADLRGICMPDFPFYP